MFIYYVYIIQILLLNDVCNSVNDVTFTPYTSFPIRLACLSGLCSVPYTGDEVSEPFADESE